MKEGKKTGAQRTQKATRDEEWSDERLKACLDVLPPEGMPQDFIDMATAKMATINDAWTKIQKQRGLK